MKKKNTIHVARKMSSLGLNMFLKVNYFIIILVSLLLFSRFYMVIS
jgi:hypothetical protein